jgi:DNA-binding transcriptional ArsR family regulator
MGTKSAPKVESDDGQPHPSADATAADVRPEAPSRAELFDVLQNGRRRAVLECLRVDGAASVTDLAERVAAEEGDTDPEGVPDQRRKSVYVSLYQNHLSRLDETGLVAYDCDDGTVTLGECADDALALLSDGDAGAELPRYLYAALAVAAVGLVGALGLGPAAPLWARAWAVAALAALAALVSAELYRQRAARRR